MSEKRFNSRIIHKHDTEINWLKSSFIPLQGELVVYDIDATHSYERIKIGDGSHNVNALPFVDDALKNILIANHYTKEEIDTYEFITVEDIDAICGGTIKSANEVVF